MENKALDLPKCIFTIEDYRISLIEQLPSLLHKLTCEYRDFAATKTPHDIKSFSTYHTTCRAALTHLQLLIKIADWAQPSIAKDIGVDDENCLDRLILDARDAISDHTQQQK